MLHVLRVTCPAHLIVFHCIAPVLCNEYAIQIIKLPLCNFLRPLYPLLEVLITLFSFKNPQFVFFRCGEAPNFTSI
jgi:hypothetical protein